MTLHLARAMGMSDIDQVSFAISPDIQVSNSTTAFVKLVNSGNWYRCNLSGLTASCDTSGGLDLAAVDQLRVVIGSEPP